MIAPRWRKLLLTTHVISSVGSLAGLEAIAAHKAVSPADLLQLQDRDHATHAFGAILVLGTAVTLSIYRPRKLTPYGQRRRAGSGR
ncbi:hypothetical protein ACWEPC_06785 [Nonomuraea sp. NPDC004297]